MPDRPCYVYTIVHRDSGRSYVGISLNPARRWAQHRWIARHAPAKHLHRAIAKRGVESFDWTVQACLPSVADAQAVEASAVSSGMYAYNHTSGGEHATPDAQTRRKLSEKLTGRTFDEGFGARVSEGLKKRWREYGHPRQGAKLSEASRAKISAKLKARYEMPGAKDFLYRQSVSAETRAKMAESAKKRFARDGHPRQGTTHTSEARAKMSAAQRKKAAD